MQSCYLAGPGTVDQVTILREGTDGAEMKVVPTNPVVVELVKERYCFVASRDVLFEDPETAGQEAERLRIEDVETRRRRREIQQMINSMDSQGTDGSTDLQPAPQRLVLVSAPEEEEGTIEVEEPQRVIDVEPEFPKPQLDLNEPSDGSNPASTANFLRNIQRVIGNETLSLEEAHLRLKTAKLMPATNEPINYIRCQLSGNRPLFERPTRMSVCLAEDNPFRAYPWKPEEIPVKAKKPSKAKKKSSKAKAESEVSTLPLNVVKKPAEVKKPAKAKKPAAPLKISPVFLTWLGNSMIQKTHGEAKFSDPKIRLIELKKGTSWVCEITVTGVAQVFVGKSARRDHARHKAEEAMTEATNKLNIMVHRAHHPEEND